MPPPIKTIDVRLEEQQHALALVRRCLAGDAAAWEEIVRVHNRRIYNLCYRFTGSTHDAEDLTQEVFIKIYRTLKSYESGKGGFVTWISTLTRNLLVDHYRSQRQERLTDPLDAAADDESLSLAERLPDSAPSPEFRVGTAAAIPGTARGSDSAGLTGHGLSRDRQSFESTRRYGEIPNQQGAHGTCAPTGTYL